MTAIAERVPSRFPWLSVAGLCAVNAVPLVGALWLGWDLGLVLLLYWAESAVVLGFSLAKLVGHDGRGALVTVPLFLFLGGTFMGVHLLVIVLLFFDAPDGWAGLARALSLGLAGFVLSHGLSFHANHLGRREVYASSWDVMAGFFKRTAPLHFAAIGGAFAVDGIGSPLWALVPLVGLKTLVDVGAHLAERRAHARSLAPVPAASHA